eukprot:TRINITY_DN3869_c0_g1_i4.p1 TRINITY_DN3869_c0_g1~~TRINITY_DN3869_c0_g1_i4.p1  ORF type:complete len:450 (-),score=23.30 TRINITY_DN3869_c0_g1_i4:117-1466(-)
MKFVNFATRQKLTPLTFVVLMFNYCAHYHFERVIVNSLEAALFITAYLHFRRTKHAGLKENTLRDELMFRALVIFNFAMRPSSLIPWMAILIADTLRSIPQFRSFMYNIFKNAVLVLLAVLTSIAVDSMYYGKFVFTVWNFLQFNVIEGGSAAYGVHALGWYAHSVIPLFLNMWAPLALVGFYKSYFASTNSTEEGEGEADSNDQEDKRRLIKDSSKANNIYDIIALVWSLLVLSFLKHKEERFILFVFPFLVLWIVIGFKALVESALSSRLKKIYLWVAIIFNVLLCTYVDYFHQRGVFATMQYLRSDWGQLQAVQFLTECHSHPGIALFHKNITYSFPDCSPQSDPNRISESRRLFIDPEEFFERQLNGSTSNQQPSHVVTYNFFTRDKHIKRILDQAGYEKAYEAFHVIAMETQIGQPVGDVFFEVYKKRKGLTPPISQKESLFIL